MLRRGRSWSQRLGSLPSHGILWFHNYPPLLRIKLARIYKTTPFVPLQEDRYISQLEQFQWRTTKMVRELEQWHCKEILQALCLFTSGKEHSLGVVTNSSLPIPTRWSSRRWRHVLYLVRRQEITDMKLKQQWFRLDRFSTLKQSQTTKEIAREAVQSPSLRVLKTKVGKAGAHFSVDLGLSLDYLTSCSI